MNRVEVISRLNDLAETDYKEFNLRIIPTEKEVLGVRLPALRLLAKEIAKADWRHFLQEAENNVYEEQMLQGLVIGYAKMDIAERIQYLRWFAPKIENWAVCDSVSGTLKFIGKNKPDFFVFVQDLLTSTAEFELRFAVVMLMDYYICDEYINRVLEIYDQIKSDKYYVQMAVAWGISVCYVKYPQLTMEYLLNNSWDDFTYNKALQKIVESNRVDKETKTLIKTMKRKKI